MPDFSTRLKNYLVNYFALRSQLVDQSQAEQDIREGVSFRGTNIIILVLAILIASLGLNTNSTAVIIGAMLISPLMGPIIGLGLGVGIHDYTLIKQALRNLVMAAGFSILASTLYFLISPVGEVHSELLARTSPSIYDVLIGFVGGGAGILAIASRSKGNVIPGVAIATALMPPLCTAGYGLATWQLNYFFGAGYLFIINSIYIAFATFIGVKALGYKSSDNVVTSRARRIKHIVYTLAILTMLPSIWLTYRMYNTNRFVMRAQQFVSAECHFPATQVLSDKASTVNGQPTITITLLGRTLPIDSLQLALAPRLRYYNLEGTRLVFIQGAPDSQVDVSGSDRMRDIYELSQATIMHQQHLIDSLRQTIHSAASAMDAGQQLMPELRVVFPQVSRIAVTTAVFAAATDSATLDTTHLALVQYSSPITDAQQQKLTSYLRARLNLPKLSIQRIN